MVNPNRILMSLGQFTPGASSRRQQPGSADGDSKSLPPVPAIGYDSQQQQVPTNDPASLQTQANLTGGDFVERTLDKFEKQSVEVASLRTMNIQLNEDLKTHSKEYGDLCVRYNDLLEAKNALQNEINNRTMISEGKLEAERNKLRRRDEEREGLQRQLNKLKGLQSSLEKAQSNLEKSKRELNDANTKLINKQEYIRQQKSELDGKDRKIKSQQNELEKLQRTAEEQMESMRRLKSELASVDTELESKRIECRRLEEQNNMKGDCIREIEKELHELKSSSENQAHDIRKLQEKAFQHVEEGQWMPDTNREVSDQLNGLSKQLQRWCRNFSRKSMLRVNELTADDQTRLHEILSQVAHTVNGELLFQFGDPATGSRLPEVLLMSALSHDLYKAIFSDPFFFESHDGQSESSTGTALAKLWSDLLEGNSSNFSNLNRNTNGEQATRKQQITGAQKPFDYLIPTQQT
jgi:myosin heavy subunit